MNKQQLIEKIDSMCNFWWNMRDSIKPSYPDNHMCIWIERRHACPVMWHFWHEVQYHINAALFLDIDEDFFWENLSQYVTELEAFQKEALELAKANRITTPRWHKDELEERILASVGRLDERFRVVNYANGYW